MGIVVDNKIEPQLPRIVLRTIPYLLSTHFLKINRRSNVWLRHLFIRDVGKIGLR